MIKPETDAESIKRATKEADEFNARVREVENQSKSELIQKAVLDTAKDIVRSVMEKHAAKTNENAHRWLQEMVREELLKMNIGEIVRTEVGRTLKEIKEGIGDTPFLHALEEAETK